MNGTILMALGLVCVIEGLTYALVPVQLKKLMVSMQTMSNERMRIAGTCVLAIGVGVVWLARG